MNEPIISPWVFYWIDILLGLKVLPFLLFCIFIFLVILTVVYFIVLDTTGTLKEQQKDLQKLVNRIFIPYLIVSTLLSVITFFIPSKDTMYQMLISSYVTPNNIEYIKNEVKGSAQGIVDSITDASIKIIKAKEGK